MDQYQNEFDPDKLISEQHRYQSHRDLNRQGSKFSNLDSLSKLEGGSQKTTKKSMNDPFDRFNIPEAEYDAMLPPCAEVV